MGGVCTWAEQSLARSKVTPLRLRSASHRHKADRLRKPSSQGKKTVTVAVAAAAERAPVTSSEVSLSVFDQSGPSAWL